MSGSKWVDDLSTCAYCEHPITLDNRGVGRSNLTLSTTCSGDTDGWNENEPHVAERWDGNYAAPISNRKVNNEMGNINNNKIDDLIEERKAEIEALQSRVDQAIGDFETELDYYQCNVEAKLLDGLRAFERFHRRTRRHHYCVDAVRDLLVKFGVSLEELELGR